MTQEKSKQQKESRIVVDATNAVVGRLATSAAKQALTGKQVIIVNSEKAIIIGNKKNILEKYAARIARGGGSQKGPHFPRKPEAILRRAIRGMLPFDRARGREALKNVKCYASLPKDFESAEKISIGKTKSIKSITLEEVSRLV